MKFSKSSNRMLSFIMTTCIIIISVIIFLIISFSMQNVYLSALEDMTSVAIHNIEEHIQLHKDESVFITKMKSFTEYMTYYQERTMNSASANTAYSQSFNYIFKKVESTQTINKITIVDTERKILISSDPIDVNSSLSKDSNYMKSTNNGIGSTSIQRNPNGEYIILISQPVILYDKNVGFLFMELSFDMINSLMQSYKFGDSGNLFLITKQLDFVGIDADNMPQNVDSIVENENIFQFSKNNTRNVPELFTTAFKTDSSSRFMIYSQIGNIDAIIATSINKSEVNKTATAIAIPLVFLLLVILIMLYIYRFIISRKILHPLALLNRSLYMIKKGDLRARFNYNALNEFGNLSAVFNQTMSNLQDLTLSLKEKETKNNIILNNITDVVWEYDILSDTIKMPENWAKLIEITPTAPFNGYIYSTNDFLEYIHINYSSDFVDDIIKCTEHNIPISLECQIKQNNDNFIWVKFNGSCMYNAYNEPYKIIGSILDISEIKTREDILKDYAKRDDLTKLLRKAEMERIVDIDLKNNGVGHSLMMLDLDGFKSINDTYGHLIGDEIIIYTANVLNKLCKNDSYICRFGGDEFIIYTRAVYTLEQTKELANKIIVELNKGYCKSDDLTIYIGCSIGISRSPIHGNTYVQLMENADLAIYSAKKHDKNRYVVYSEDVNDIDN